MDHYFFIIIIIIININYIYFKFFESFFSSSSLFSFSSLHCAIHVIVHAALIALLNSCHIYIIYNGTLLILNDTSPWKASWQIYAPHFY